MTIPFLDLKAATAELRPELDAAHARAAAHYAERKRLLAGSSRLDEIARAIADAPQRPTWNKGDFFGQRFGR
jgi:hypothetical protein